VVVNLDREFLLDKISSAGLTGSSPLIYLSVVVKFLCLNILWIVTIGTSAWAKMLAVKCLIAWNPKGLTPAGLQSALISLLRAVKEFLLSGPFPLSAVTYSPHTTSLRKSRGMWSTDNPLKPRPPPPQLIYF